MREEYVEALNSRHVDEIDVVCNTIVIRPAL